VILYDTKNSAEDTEMTKIMGDFMPNQQTESDTLLIHINLSFSCANYFQSSCIL